MPILNPRPPLDRGYTLCYIVPMAIPTNLKKPVYPMRPAKGGKLELSRPKGDDWVGQAKVNGQRVTIDKNTGTVHSRYGEVYSHAPKIAKAVARLQELFPKNFNLVDCEAMYGRQKSTGSLVVLDSFMEGTQEERRKALSFLPILPTKFKDIKADEVYLVQEVTGSKTLKLYEKLKASDPDLFEGVVMKRKDSKYQVGRNSNDSNYAWVKHRFDQ
jgi:ATP-dependent DNA ligase